jgi:hypothetical protein
MKEYLTIYLTINEEKSTQPRNELSHDKICGTRHALTEVEVCNGINDEYMMMMMMMLLLLLLLFLVDLVWIFLLGWRPRPASSPK